VWTCQKHGRPIPKLEATFASASPSLTHMAIVELLQNGPVQYVVSQNVDGVHRRSGLPADKLAEVHGNCFLEKCPNCGSVFVRDFEAATVGFQSTGRRCSTPRCRCALQLVSTWRLPQAYVVSYRRRHTKASHMGFQHRKDTYIGRIPT
jgi:NAD+-dependent protein deacetylase sirtuin 6